MITDNIGFDGGSLTLGAVERERRKREEDARALIEAYFSAVFEMVDPKIFANDLIECLSAKGFKIVAREPTMENEMYYLRSILHCLREAKSFANSRNTEPTFGNGALADNIDWLDCYIDARAQELDPK